MKTKLFIGIITLLIIISAVGYFTYQYFYKNSFNDVNYPDRYLITISMKSDISDEDMQDIKDSIIENKRNYDLKYISKEEVKAEFSEIEIYQNIMKDWPEDYNPFNPKYLFTAKAKDIDDINAYIEEIKKWESVDSVNYNIAQENDSNSE